MFDELIKFLRAAGADVPPAVAQQAEAQMYQTFGGERIYIPHRPVQQRAVQLANLERMKLREMAVVTGMSVRTIKRIRNGK